MQKMKNFASFVPKNRLFCHPQIAESGTKPIFPHEQYFFPSGNDVGRSGQSLFANAGMLLLPWGQHRKKGLGKKVCCCFPRIREEITYALNIFSSFLYKFFISNLVHRKRRCEKKLGLDPN